MVSRFVFVSSLKHCCACVCFSYDDRVQEAKSTRAEHWATVREQRAAAAAAERARKEKELADSELTWRLQQEVAKEKAMKDRLLMQVRERAFAFEK